MKARIAQSLADRKEMKDPFRTANGYNWDMVMVFKVHDHDEKLSEYPRKHSVKFIVDHLAKGGLEAKLSYSIQKDEIYLKIRATIQRLMKEADRIDYCLLLNDIQVCNALQEGNAIKGWKGVSIPPPNQTIETDIDPYAYIYAPFEYDSASRAPRSDLASLFQKHGLGDSIFRGVDGVKLLLSIIAAKSYAGGCSLDIHKLVDKGVILGYSPLHDYVELKDLEEQWLRFIQYPWRQKVDHVRGKQHWR